MNKELLEVNGYDIDKIIQDTLFNLPTLIDGVGEVYPITVKDFDNFNKKYMKYIVLNHDYLDIAQSESLLNSLLLLGIMEEREKLIKNENSYNNAFQSLNMQDPISMMEQNNKINEQKKIDELNDEAFYNTVNDMCDMMSFLFRRKVTFSENIIGFDVWVTETVTMPITDKEYMIFREIVMIQNGLAEVKRYKDPIIEEWMNKAKNARRRKDITFNDVLIFVKNETNTSYKQIADYPILAFYCDYYEKIHKNEYENSILFKTVSDKIPDIQCIEPIFDKLYNNSDEDLVIDMESITKKLD